MFRVHPARPAARRGRPTIALVLLAVVVFPGGCRSLPDLLSATSVGKPEPSAHRSHPRLGEHVPGDAPRPLPGGRHQVIGTADGEVPDGVTVFDDHYPAVANLDPSLLDALRRAATEAGDEGIDFYVNSGWRSAAYQERLLDDAVATYGSRAEAARWVATPSTSPHVSGDAVDLGKAAAAWLSQHGAGYGLCQIYRNEPWHYELRADAVAQGCPAMYADPTDDPRMRR